MKNFFEGMFLDKCTHTHTHTLHEDPLPTVKDRNTS